MHSLKELIREANQWLVNWFMEIDFSSQSLKEKNRFFPWELRKQLFLVSRCCSFYEAFGRVSLLLLFHQKYVTFIPFIPETCCFVFSEQKRGLWESKIQEKCMKCLAQPWPHSKWMVNQREARHGITEWGWRKARAGDTASCAHGGHISAWDMSQRECVAFSSLSLDQFLDLEPWFIILDVNTD